MKKLAVLNTFVVLLMLSVALMLFSGPDQAYVYDDFTGSGINGSLWTEKGPNEGLFSQPGDGYLYYSCTTTAWKDNLGSKNPVSGAFFVAMQYSNFQGDNTATAGQSEGVYLQLSDGTNIVGVDRLNNNSQTSHNWFQGFSIIGTIQTYSSPIQTNVNSGWLGIGYNGISGSGGQVTLWYNKGAGWTKIATYVPNFTSNPYFSIMGKTQTGTSLSFWVDKVELTLGPPTSTPIGSLMLLLD